MLKRISLYGHAFFASSGTEVGPDGDSACPCVTTVPCSNAAKRWALIKQSIGSTWYPILRTEIDILRFKSRDGSYAERADKILGIASGAADSCDTGNNICSVLA